MRETPEAAFAFERYYADGEERSLLTLARKMREELIARQGNQKSTKPLPSEATLLSRLKKWSAAHGWQERIIARDREQARREQKKRQKELASMNERQALIGTTQQARAIKQIEELIATKKFGSLASVQLLKLATDLERIARGAATEQIALTGESGGPLIIETQWGTTKVIRDQAEEEK